MYHAVCPLQRLGHNSSVEERMQLTVCPLHSSGSSPGCGRVFQRIFFWLITLCKPVLRQHGRKWLNTPEWHRATCGHRAGRPESNYDQTMAEQKRKV